MSTEAQQKVIDRAVKRGGIINFKVNTKTLRSMLRDGLVELHTQKEPYFLEYYRLTNNEVG